MPDGGDRFLHLDLHPLNVIMSARGPIVIDWANASRGEALTDVGGDLRAAHLPEHAGPARADRRAATGARRSRGACSRSVTRARRSMPASREMAELKTLDTNMAPEEIVAMQRLAARRRR